MLRVFNNTARYVDQGGNKVCNSKVVYDTWSFMPTTRENFFMGNHLHQFGAEFHVLEAIPVSSISKWFETLDFC
jgi:hypothetical protein